MNVEFVNPFIEASTHIIYQTTRMTPKLGKIYVKAKPYASDNILVLIGLTGKISGNVVISLNREVACKIASAMMNDMPVTDFNDMAKSAISELCNMILGNTATLFSKKGEAIDITPPTMLMGENLYLSVHKSTIVCVPLLFEDGSTIELDISFVNK